jgi:hypothetical protein
MGRDEEILYRYICKIKITNASIFISRGKALDFFTSAELTLCRNILNRFNEKENYTSGT